MATILKAGNVATGAQITSDATGILEVRTGTGAGTTAITVGTNQAVTMAGAVSSSSLTVNSNNISAVNSLGFRNRIINGDCRIDQRNAGASVTPATGTYNNYCVDRFPFSTDGGGRVTAQQSSITPAGFPFSLGLTVQTADAAIAAGDQYWLEHRIEGNNFADLAFGSASAQTFTLSFWVRSSVTGTYSVAFRNSAGNRSYVAAYTVNAANTWEQKTITVAGDTTGTWVATNGIGIGILFDLGSGSTFNGTAGSWQTANLYRTSGSVNWISNAGATFYITGVQLEAGSVATPFERRDYGRELAMAQRYYVRLNDPSGTSLFVPIGMGYNFSSTSGTFQCPLPVPMRTRPTTVNLSNISIYQASGGVRAAVTSISGNQSSNTIWMADVITAGGLTSGTVAALQGNNNTAAYAEFSAEL
jgi:hypothetical protein